MSEIWGEGNFERNFPIKKVLHFYSSLMTVKQESDKCWKLLLEFKVLNKSEQQN